jgi:hypothetical protein
MVETPKYKVVRRIGNVEIRQYPALILATTKIKAEEASNEAFGIIAGYIFGGNDANRQISMTAPVMTTNEKDIFSMSFVMPSSFDIGSLPKPTSKNIILQRKKPSRFAVIKFSGYVNKGKLSKYAELLKSSLDKNRIKFKGNPILMRYNPPWTLPFLRKNEIALELL